MTTQQRRRSRVRRNRHKSHVRLNNETDIKILVLTSSWTASTLGLLPVRRRPEPGPLLAMVASDLDLWWVLLDGETNTSSSPCTGLSGAGPAVEKEGGDSVLLLLCLR